MKIIEDGKTPQEALTNARADLVAVLNRYEELRKDQVEMDRLLFVG